MGGSVGIRIQLFLIPKSLLPLTLGTGAAEREAMCPEQLPEASPLGL